VVLVSSKEDLNLFVPVSFDGNLISSHLLSCFYLISSQRRKLLIKLTIKLPIVASFLLFFFFFLLLLLIIKVD